MQTDPASADMKDCDASITSDESLANVLRQQGLIQVQSIEAKSLLKSQELTTVLHALRNNRFRQDAEECLSLQTPNWMRLQRIQQLEALARESKCLEAREAILHILNECEKRQKTVYAGLRLELRDIRERVLAVDYGGKKSAVDECDVSKEEPEVFAKSVGFKPPKQPSYKVRPKESFLERSGFSPRNYTTNQKAVEQL
jgi:hypothetical protein